MVYGDYLCPRTREAWPVLEELEGDLGDRLRLVWRHLPLGDRPASWLAARAAEVAGARGRFWPMHRALFAAQDVLAGAEMLSYAALKAGLDPKVLDGEAGRPAAARVLTDAESALGSGASETPAFFVNGARWDGGAFLAAVLLAATEPASTGPPDGRARGPEERSA